MKRKSVGAMILAGACAVSMLGGCGSAKSKTEGTETKTAKTEDVTLKIWVPEEEVDLTDKMVKKFDELHEEFNIKYEIAVVGIDEAPQALETDADTAADIFYTPSGGVADMAAKGLLLPITKDYETIKDELPESALTAVTVDDITYAVPFSPNTFFMYYNKDFYTEDEVKNLDTMLAKDLGDKVYNFSSKMTDSWYSEMYFLGNGGNLFGEDGTDPTKCSFNDEKGVEAGKYMIDLVHNPKYIEDLDGVGGAEFKKGNCGAITSGAWSAPEFREAIGDKLGAVALPTAKIGEKEVQLSNFVDFKTITVKSNTKYPLAAQQLAVFMGNQENSINRYREQGDIPVLSSLASSEEIQKNEVAAALNAQAAVATNQPSIPKMGDYWDPMKALGEGIYYGDVTKANLKEKLDALVDSITGTLTE